MLRSSNPAFNANVLSRAQGYSTGEVMTVQGTVNKSFVLLGLLLITASWVWGKVVQPAPMFEDAAAQQTVSNVSGFLMFGLFGGLIAGMVTIFKPQIARITAPVYALCEGLIIGGLSAIFEMSYPGIVMQAVALTFGVMFCMLTLYRTGMIKVTDKLRMGITAAVGAIFLVYVVNMIMGFFGGGMPMIHSSSPVGIGFSLIVCGIAAFSLLLDFDMIDRLSAQGAPRHMEWYGAFALMVTLIWLYLEILRLLAKMNNRR